MADLDEIFDEQESVGEKGESKTMTREEWQAKREQLRTEAFEKLEEATGRLSDPAALTTYFDVQSRLDRYSVSNVILIAAQKPDATRLADFNYWQKHEAGIKKGEHAIMILEPREYEKADGTKGVSYDPKKVFDISQTTIEPKQYRKKPVDEKRLIKALTKTSPVRMVIDNELPEGVNARFSPDAGVIGVRQGMSGDEIFRALAGEIAKARAASDQRNVGGFEITAVTYILCRRNDITPPDLPAGNPFEGKEPKDVRSILKGIRDEANNISSVISKTLEPGKGKEAR